MYVRRIPHLWALHLQAIFLNVDKDFPKAALGLEEGVGGSDHIAVDAGLRQDVCGKNTQSHIHGSRKIFFFLYRYR